MIYFNKNNLTILILVNICNDPKLYNNVVLVVQAPALSHKVY